MDVDTAFYRLHQRNPWALRLAELSCLAPRVDPALLRALRRRFMAVADPSAELDLWFSSLAHARSPSVLLFDDAVLQRLRDTLAADPIKDQVVQATLDQQPVGAHRLRLEVKLNALPVLNPAVTDATLEVALQPLLDDLRGGGEPALEAARWLLEAAPRWHARLRRTPGAWAALLAASALLDGRRLVDDPVPQGLDLQRLAAALPSNLVARQTVGVRMTRWRLHLVKADRRSDAVVRVPALQPALLVVHGAGPVPQLINAEPGAQIDLPDVDAVELRNLLGDGWRVEPARSAPRRAAKPKSDRRPSRGRIVARMAGRGVLSLQTWLDDQPLHDTWRITDAGWLAALQEGAAARARELDRQAPLWQDFPQRDWFRALAALADCEVVELDADVASQWLPWEWLQLDGLQPARRDLGLRLLRHPGVFGPTGPAAWAAPDPPAALVITNPEGTLTTPLTALRAEGQTLAKLLSQGERLHTRHLDNAPAKAVIQALLERPLTVLHWSGRSMVDEPQAALGRPWRRGVALGSDTLFGPREADTLRQPPMMAMFNLDRSGFDPESAASGSAADAPASWNPLFALMARGTRIGVATAGVTSPVASVVFAAVLYSALCEGLPLHEALWRARKMTQERHPGDDTAWRFQVWGLPDERLPLRSTAGTKARPAAPAAPPAPTPPSAAHPAAASLLQLSDLGDQRGPFSGFWIGHGLVATVRAPFRELPFVAGYDAQRRSSQFSTRPDDGSAASDEGDRSPVLVAALVDGLPGTVLELAHAMPSASPFAAELVYLLDGQVQTVAVQVSAGGSRPWLQVQAKHPRDQLSPQAIGAPLLLDGRCVGLLAATGERNLEGAVANATAVGLATLRDALQQRQMATIQEHALYVRSEHRQGRMLDQPGMDLSRRDLVGVSLSGANLPGANLSDANLDGANLSGANLQGARLRRSRLTGANLSDARLGQADLRRTQAEGANFSQADLRAADLTEGHFAGCNFSAATLSAARVGQAVFDGANLLDADLSDLVGEMITHGAAGRRRVFISHAGQDDEAAAQVRGALDVLGMVGGPDLPALPSGAAWDAEQRDWLATAQAGVLLWSHASQSSVHQQAEWLELRHRGVPLLALQVDDGPLPTELQDMLVLRLGSVPLQAWPEALVEPLHRLKSALEARRSGPAPPP